MREIKPCPWCYCITRKGLTPLRSGEIEWTVIDDDFGQYLHPSMIHYCFSCGRKLDEPDETEKKKVSE